MRLLVSVTNAAEARAALKGGADLIDAKDPAAGALGVVAIDEFHRIVGAVAGARPASAALGDAAEEAAVERSAGAFAQAGAVFVKVGFAGTANADRVASLMAAAVRGAADGRCAGLQSCEREREAKALRHFPENRGVVAVAYADANRANSILPRSLIDIAARSGAAGVLLDTFDKSHGGLLELVARSALGSWVAAAHDAGLFVALAGKLTASDLPVIRDAGADIVGVRGAVCCGDRTGHVTADRVRLVRSACDRESPYAPIGGEGGRL
jgi:(5-formylfuran-3-yl)methyl phosphate synthase